MIGQKNSQISQKAISLLSVTVLSLITLAGCTPKQPPTATTEPTPKTEVANNGTAEPAPKTEPAANNGQKTESETLKNLQTAYNGESNANVRYLAFAEKADAEGYKQVATLFRAAAMAEQIHRDNHAAVIRKMGGTPEAKIDTPEVKSTAENLQAAITGESYERDTMYPQFIEQARKEGNLEAVRTLDWAMEAEKEHANYYTTAKDNLEDWKEAKLAFYVCPQCGLTTDNLNFEKCPECGEPKEDFKKVV